MKTNGVNVIIRISGFTIEKEIQLVYSAGCYANSNEAAEMGEPGVYIPTQAKSRTKPPCKATASSKPG
jgi:hypothetical protein